MFFTPQISYVLNLRYILSLRVVAQKQEKKKEGINWITYANSIRLVKGLNKLISLTSHMDCTC